jgi:hypothetical protein
LSFLPHASIFFFAVRYWENNKLPLLDNHLGVQILEEEVPSMFPVGPRQMVLLERSCWVFICVESGSSNAWLHAPRYLQCCFQFSYHLRINSLGKLIRYALFVYVSIKE